MEISLCQFESCKLDPEYLCKGFEHSNYFCTEHLEVHCGEGNDHNISKNFIDLVESDRVILINKCKISLRSLKEMKTNISKKLNESIEKLMKQSINDFEFIRKKELLISEVINFLKLKNKLILRAMQSKEEKFIMKYISTPDKLTKKISEKEAQIICKLDFEQRETNLKAQIEKFQEDFQEKLILLDEKHKESIADETKKFQLTIEEINNSMLDNIAQLKNRLTYLEENTGYIQDDDKESQYFYFFNQDSKRLNTINLASDKDTFYDYDIPDLMGYSGGFCMVSPELFFVNSGYVGGAYITGNTYIFNLEQKSAEKKESLKIRGFNGVCSFLNDCIYSFAGYNLSALLTESVKFDLNAGKWQNIQDLPLATHCNSSVVFGNKIIIIGYNIASAYIYSVQENSYSSVGVFQASCYKMIFKVRNKVYVLENNKLHENTCPGLGQFSYIATSIGVGERLTCIPTTYKKEVYFMVRNNNSIFKINLQTKSVTVFRNTNFN
ncbi:hypothetical protein SteCoe_30389 [Stentor coeruleus]|uniref:Uncharacterized protein n=1 Tax=Stentor coeruleus TaxID=5963 RepID=A0A1R2B3N9_9CILI|nr:hypothetical protein SteCoe_30389 [Stentor coeruleus]